jgi:hypothetical protein
VKVSCGPVSFGPVEVEVNDAGAIVPLGTRNPIQSWDGSKLASSPELPLFEQDPLGPLLPSDAHTLKVIATFPIVFCCAAVGVPSNTAQPLSASAPNPTKIPERTSRMYPTV